MPKITITCRRFVPHQGSDGRIGEADFRLHQTMLTLVGCEVARTSAGITVAPPYGVIAFDNPLVKARFSDACVRALIKRFGNPPTPQGRAS